MIGVTTAVILDTRKIRKDGRYSVKLRITHNREQKYYPVNIQLSKEDWTRTESDKPRNEYKEHRLYFNKIEQRALDIIKELHPFTFEYFEKKFDQKTDRHKDVFFFFDRYIKLLNSEERSGTESSYQCAYNSIEKFVKTKNRKILNFRDVTPAWLAEYEKWMIDSNKSVTSVGIYLRSLRTILNIGIADGLMSQEFYPFGKRKYVIPSGRNVKKALALNDIKEIFNYTPATKAEERSRDLWLLSYLCNGANMKDIARLQYKNIDRSTIQFIRAKTERTTKQNLKSIIVMLLPEIESIIQKWGLKPVEPETYVFDIIEKNDDSKRKLIKIRQAIKVINKYMKRIGKNLNIEMSLTTYTARHSFATILKRSGASTEFIGESLGHKDNKTTQNYLDSFEDDVKITYQRKLLNFS